MSTESVGQVHPRMRMECDTWRRSQYLGITWSFHDRAEDTIQVLFGIPWILTVVFTLSFAPGRFIRWVTRGPGESVYYGVECSHYHVHVQWGKILDLPGKEGGWEWRRVWEDFAGERRETRRNLSETVIGATLPAVGSQALQYFHVLVEAIEVHSQWNVWWRPSLRHRYFTVTPMNRALLDVDGRWACRDEVTSEHIVSTSPDAAAREYRLNLASRLGYDLSHL